MCFVVAKDWVRIRTCPCVSPNCPAVGQLPPGGRLSASCSAVAGCHYPDCGGSNVWVPVTYRGATRYVAWACVNWYYDTAATSGEDAVAAEMRAETQEAIVLPTPEPAPQMNG
jgi:hypothetical protein